MHSNFVKRLLKAAWFWSWWSPSSFWPSPCWSCSFWGREPFPRCWGELQRRRFFADAMTIVVGIEFVKMLMLHTPPGGHRRAALCHRPAACGQPLQRGGHPAGVAAVA